MAHVLGDSLRGGMASEKKFLPASVPLGFSLRYDDRGSHFPQASKASVTGDQAHPLLLGGHFAHGQESLRGMTVPSIGTPNAAVSKLRSSPESSSALAILPCPDYYQSQTQSTATASETSTDAPWTSGKQTKAPPGSSRAEGGRQDSSKLHPPKALLLPPRLHFESEASPMSARMGCEVTPAHAASPSQKVNLRQGHQKQATIVLKLTYQDLVRVQASPERPSPPASSSFVTSHMCRFVNEPSSGCECSRPCPWSSRWERITLQRGWRPHRPEISPETGKAAMGSQRAAARGSKPNAPSEQSASLSGSTPQGGGQLSRADPQRQRINSRNSFSESFSEQSANGVDGSRCGQNREWLAASTASTQARRLAPHELDAYSGVSTNLEMSFGKETMGASKARTNSPRRTESTKANAHRDCVWASEKVVGGGGRCSLKQVSASDRLNSENKAWVSLSQISMTSSIHVEAGHTAQPSDSEASPPGSEGQSYSGRLLLSRGRLDKSRLEETGREAGGNTSSCQSQGLPGTQHLPDADDSETQTQILKDVARTYPESVRFSEEKRLELGFLLAEQAQSQPKIGYMQGMNFLGAVIGYHAPSFEVARLIFAWLLQAYRPVYEPSSLEFSLEQAERVAEGLRLCCNDLHSHLSVNLELGLELVVRHWFFSMMGSFVPLESMHWVVDRFLVAGFEGLRAVMIALLIYMKEDLMGVAEAEALQEALTEGKLRELGKGVDWGELTARSCGLTQYAQ